MYPHGCSERLALLKSDGSVYHVALLPHEVHRICHEKEKEIERKHVLKMSTEREAGNRPRFNRGELSRAQQGRIPPLAPMVESRVYMNFPDFHAPTERRVDALNVARSWSTETIKSQLAKNAISVKLKQILTCFLTLLFVDPTISIF